MQSGHDCRDAAVTLPTCIEYDGPPTCPRTSSAPQAPTALAFTRSLPRAEAKGKARAEAKGKARAAAKEKKKITCYPDDPSRPLAYCDVIPLASIDKGEGRKGGRKRALWPLAPHCISTCWSRRVACLTWRHFRPDPSSSLFSRCRWDGGVDGPQYMAKVGAGHCLAAVQDLSWVRWTTRRGEGRAWPRGFADWGGGGQTLPTRGLAGWRWGGDSSYSREAAGETCRRAGRDSGPGIV